MAGTRASTRYSPLSVVTNSMKKAASAYLYGGKIYLHPHSKTTEGVWILSSPILTTSEQDQQLGNKLMSTLSKSTENAPHPKSWKGIDDPLIKAEGARSFAAFVKAARAVFIILDNNGVAFIPSRNGPKGSSIHLNEKIIHTDPSGGNLANALIEAFAACEQD
jgi:hypothetical protein